MMSKIIECLCSLAEKKRERYKQRKQKRLKNPAPTIICNNCVGGTIYRDLNLPYYSPTAYVLIQMSDFFRFVSDLEYYLTCIPEESFLEGVTYPVGVLRKGSEAVVLRFMHETDFETAKEKWIRRCGRVDFDNLYIVLSQTFAKNRIFLSKRNMWYKEFKKIQHPHKRMLVNVWMSYDKEIIPLGIWSFIRKKTGSVLDYPTRFSKKRRMDRFDYVSFLNEKEM